MFVKQKGSSKLYGDDIYLHSVLCKFRSKSSMLFRW